MASITTIASWSSADYQSATAAQIASLTTAQVASMAHPDWMLPAAIAGFSATQIPFISIGWNWMSAAWLNALSPSAFAAIPPAGTGQFSGTALAGLDAAHAAALTTAQIAGLASPQSLSVAAVAALSAVQVAAIPAAKWSSLGAAWLNALPPSIFASIPSTNIALIAKATLTGLDASHVASMTTSQMAAITTPQGMPAAFMTAALIGAIPSTYNWANMGSPWLNQLPASAFAAIPPAGIAQLSSSVYAGLDAAHVGAMSTAQVAALAHADWLGAAAISGLTAAQVGAITTNWYWMGANWLNAMSDAALAAIPLSGIGSLTTATIAGLDAHHIAALSSAQVAALSSAQIGALTASQIVALTTSEIAALSGTQLAAFSATQIAALTGGQVSALSTAQIASLKPAQVAALSGSAIATLSQSQIASLGTNIGYVSPAAIAALPASTIQQLSFMQVGNLKPAQMAVLTAQQLGALSAAQVNYLTPGQLAALGSHIQSLSPSAVNGLNNVNLISVYAALSSAQIAALTPAQTAAVQQAGTAVTTLLGALTDPSVLAQVSAVINAGQSLFSYGSLVKVLQGVDAGIGSTGLSQAQLNDLKALATAVGQSEGTDSYLYRITSDVVNGNTANATWTGGAAASVALGNLAVGSSADQLSKLIGKWFLGGDLPTWSGSTVYNTTDAPLFSAAGPVSTEICQGGIGDCYLMAAMVDVANDYSSLLETMFTDNGNGTYGVRFYGANRAPQYETVSNQLPSGWYASSTSGNLWVPLLEKAYVAYQVETYGWANSYTSINGGWSGGLYAITGRNSTSYSSGNINLQTWTTTTKATVLGAMGSGQEAMLASYASVADPINGKTDLVSGHMYAVLGYDAATDDLILRNPWGSAGSSGWNGTFELSFAQIWGSGNQLIVTGQAAPTGAIDPKYNVNASVGQLLQAMASDTGSNGAATSTPLVAANSLDNTRITLATPA